MDGYSLLISFKITGITAKTLSGKLPELSVPMCSTSNEGENAIIRQYIYP